LTFVNRELTRIKTRRIASWQYEEMHDADAKVGGLDQAFAGEITSSIRASEATAKFAAMVKAERISLAETSALGVTIVERKLDRVP